jgi:hypothetical protein
LQSFTSDYLLCGRHMLHKIYASYDSSTIFSIGATFALGAASNKNLTQ